MKPEEGAGGGGNAVVEKPELGGSAWSWHREQEEAEVREELGYM